MQRTNISRDIKEDLELNRIYIPKKSEDFKVIKNTRVKL